MKHIIVIFYLFIISQSSCFSTEDPILTKIMTICEYPEQIDQILFNSMFSCNSYLEDRSKDMKRSEAQTLFIQQHIEKYFKEEYTIGQDIIVKQISGPKSENDSLRYIIMKGIENKKLIFGFIFEFNGWKLFNVQNSLSNELKLLIGDTEKHLTILNDLIRKPKLIWEYTKDDSDKNIISRAITDSDKNSFIQYIKHNFDEQYIVAGQKSNTPSGSKNKLIIHDVFIENKNNKRPIMLRFEEKKDEDKVYITYIGFYRAWYGEKINDGIYRLDSLSDEELSDNHKLIQKILKDPEILIILLKDDDYTSDRFYKNAIKRKGFIDRIIKYIKQYFGGDYITEIDYGKPAIATHTFVVGQFCNGHQVVLYNKEKLRRLYITFNDIDELYKFKISDIRSMEADIDGIDYSGFGSENP